MLKGIKYNPIVKLDLKFSFFSIFSDEPLIKERQGHRIADWSDQVKKGVEDLCVSL